jgi:putative membrane protein
MAKNLLGTLYGAAFGIALVIPGFSGGTLLVIFGCYDKICGALALDFKAIKRNFLFLVLFAIGALAGVLGFAHGITFMLERFPMWTYLFFSALILAGLPSIIKAAQTDGKPFKLICIVPFILGLGLIIALAFINTTDTNAQSVGVVRLIASSALAAVTLIIPGVSGAFMLLVLGIYDVVMSALRNLDLSVILPAGIGIVLGLIVGAKLIMLLLNKFRLMVYSAIIGMVIGSVVMLVVDTLTKFS